MFIQPIDYFLLAWFVLAGASTAYVAWDQYRNNPEPVVMKWGFTVVARDGETLPPAARYKADTVNVGPGQR